MRKTSLLFLYLNPRRWHNLPRCVLFLCFVFSASLVTAQSTIKGKVTDESSVGMPGVNIVLKGSSIGTTTDANGEYSISLTEIESNAILVFSFIGFTTEEEIIGGRNTINVSLYPSIESLSEVVVVGYGTQKKSDVTGSLVSVKSEDLKEVPVANLQQALQGRAAGLEIQKIGTAPGAGAQIRIRGERSINGSNDPLIVLDGIPFEGGSLNDINQDEIASIDILKDASATAIYGSRGANGVILITTKRGKAGETKFSYDGYFGITTVARKYKLFSADEYAAMRDASTWSQGYMPLEVESMALGRSTDWQDLMYENGFISNHNINASGGNEKTQFSVGAGYFKETTVLPGQDFSRFSLRTTVDTKIGKKIKIGFNTLTSVGISNGTQFVNQQPNNSGFQNNAFGGSVMYPILSLSPLMPAYDDNGQMIKTPGGNVDDQAATYSPLMLKENNNEWVDLTKRFRSFNSLYAEYQIIEGLKYRFNLGLDYRQQEFDQFQGKDSYFRTNNLYNRASVNNAMGWGYTAENILVYEKTFREKHRLTFTGLFSAQEDHSHNTQALKEDITADFIEFYDLGQANPAYVPVLSGNESSWGLLSYMFRVNYSFDDRFLFTLTGRRDGSSRLAEKWHQYPAAAFGWNITNESFMQNVTPISNLKLRVGYGETSNQSVNPYQTLGGVSGRLDGNAIRYNYGTSNLVSGYFITSIPDKTLDWEYTRTINIGLDFGLLNNRITGSIDWYNAKTYNILYPQTLPPTSGVVGAFQTNIGNMENKGLEIAVSADIIELSNGFKWSADANWFFNRNKLVSLNDGFERNIGSGLYVGQPITAIYDYKKLGVWQTDEATEAAVFGQFPGQLKLADISGPDGIPDGVINPDYDRTIIGSGQAKWQGGITNRFSFKGFDLSFVIYARMGGTLISGLHQPFGAYLTNLDGKRSGLKVDYWTPTNPSNEFPLATTANNTSITPPLATTAWTTLGYYDASFVKMRSINFGYRLPSKIAQNIKATSLRVYVTAQNPFLLYSPYVKDHNGVDPEPTGTGNTGFVGNPGNVRVGGPNPSLVVSASTPPTRSFIFGLNIGF